MMVSAVKKAQLAAIPNYEVAGKTGTAQIPDLVKGGYLTRQEDPKDRRLVQLALSPKGKEHITAMKEKRVAEMAGLFGSLTDKELQEFVRLHKKITSNFSTKKS